MKHSIFVIIVLCILFIIPASPVYAATKPPLPLMAGPEIGEDVSKPEFLEEITATNPMYIFSNPYYEQSRLTPAVITQIRKRLPNTKIILHLFCCNLFDQKKLTNDNIAKVAFSTQNTQAEFDNAWATHQDAFMKSLDGGYVYNVIDHANNLWLDPGISYLMDPESNYYQNFLYNKFKYYVTTGGFDGIYLDLMMPGFLKTHYKPAPAIGNTLMTFDQGRDKQISLSNALQEKRANDPDPKVRNAFIFTNSVGGNTGEFYSNEDLIDYNRRLKTQGVQIENPFQDFTNIPVAKWRETVDLISKITSLRGGAMRGWINYHISEGMNSTAQCNQQSLFTYASYLLGNQSPHFAFNFLCKIQDSYLPASQRRLTPSTALAQANMGAATNPYQELSSGLFLRNYENGIVLVNPTNEQQTYRSNNDLQNAYISTVYPANSSISLSPHSGLILLKNTPPPPTGNPADLTNEGDTPGNQVNEYDYNVLVGEFGKTGSPGWIKADIIKNGKVDEFDYNALTENFDK